MERNVEPNVDFLVRHRTSEMTQADVIATQQYIVSALKRGHVKLTTCKFGDFEILVMRRSVFSWVRYEIISFSERREIRKRYPVDKKVSKRA